MPESCSASTPHGEASGLLLDDVCVPHASCLAACATQVTEQVQRIQDCAESYSDDCDGDDCQECAPMVRRARAPYLTAQVETCALTCTCKTSPAPKLEQEVFPPSTVCEDRKGSECLSCCVSALVFKRSAPRIASSNTCQGAPSPGASDESWAMWMGEAVSDTPRSEVRDFLSEVASCEESCGLDSDEFQQLAEHLDEYF